MIDFYQKEIIKLKEANLYRQPKNSYSYNSINIIEEAKEYISFCSNDYLGLSQNKEVKEAAIQAIEEYGFGSTSSRYIYGNHHLYQKLESKIAQIKGTQDAIVFGSGYLSGTSVVSALAGKSDLIIADKLIHSCLIDGAKLSGAKLLRFKHNDVDNAKKLLEDNRLKFNKCLIITETVFSMDGDLGKIDELLELAQKFDSLLISDDAHGLGILDNNLKKKLSSNYLQLGTFSKAIGGYGGYVCGEEILINYLRNFAKSAIYSTSLPPNILAGNLKSLEIIENNPNLGKKALENANYFCKLMDLPETKSTIVPIIIGDAKKTLEISNKLKEKGFLISAIRPPTVQTQKARLRITFSKNHSKKQIEEISRILIIIY